MACHASDGGGGVGPNMTDEYWLHGGSINDVYHVIKYEVPEKVMKMSHDQLSAEEKENGASYVPTLHELIPTNQTDPQDENYNPENVEGLESLGEDDIEVQEAQEE